MELWERGHRGEKPAGDPSSRRGTVRSTDRDAVSADKGVEGAGRGVCDDWTLRMEEGLHQEPWAQGRGALTCAAGLGSAPEHTCKPCRGLSWPQHQHQHPLCCLHQRGDLATPSSHHCPNTFTTASEKRRGRIPDSTEPRTAGPKREPPGGPSQILSTQLARVAPPAPSHPVLP